jgi:hypothetical protein
MVKNLLLVSNESTGFYGILPIPEPMNLTPFIKPVDLRFGPVQEFFATKREGSATNILPDSIVNSIIKDYLFSAPCQ